MVKKRKNHRCEKIIDLAGYDDVSLISFGDFNLEKRKKEKKYQTQREHISGKVRAKSARLWNSEMAVWKGGKANASGFSRTYPHRSPYLTQCVSYIYMIQLMCFFDNGIVVGYPSYTF